MQLDWIAEYFLLILDGLRTTLLLLMICGSIGLIWAFAVALALDARVFVIRHLARFYSSIIRGTPLLVQIYFFYFGLGSFFSEFAELRSSFLWPVLRDGFTYVAIALVLNVGAYVGEIIRGAMRGLPKGEVEAAAAFGMSSLQRVRYITMPRAIRILLPSLAGETTLLLKSTALASTVAVTDLMGAANVVRADTFLVYEPLLLVALIYMVITFVIEAMFRRLEVGVPRRLPQGQGR